MAQALYRKYRPKSLSEVVGQPHIVDVLKNAIEKKRIGHAYLLTGPKGTGKTSVARILAHEINNIPYTDDATHLDIIEIDAASNRRIDDIRDLREKVHIAPSIAPYKIYTIDEVHMLTNESFNALLKTLEEPPSHVIFILATTEVHKLPATIISRTQRFHFKPIGTNDVVAHLSTIAKKEKIAIDEASLELIAAHSGGSFRDSISILDQLASTSGTDPITIATIETALGLVSGDAAEQLIQASTRHDVPKIISLLDELQADGVSIATLTHQLVTALREKATTDSKYITLIDSLIEVPKSFIPEAKLIVALCQFQANDQTTDRPTKNVAQSATLVPQVASMAVKKVKKPSIDPLPVKAKDSSVDTEPTTLTMTSPITNFDWEQIQAEIKKTNAPLSSLLSKATTAYENDCITIYISVGLYRKKLADSKYKNALAQCIEKLYGTCPEIIISASAPPLSSDAAQVAALMGGGEVVHVK